MSENKFDDKLSKLFKLKQLEVPSESFWKDFDFRLQRKLADDIQDRSFSFSNIIYFPVKYYKSALASFACATCCLALLFFQLVSINSPTAIYKNQIHTVCLDANSDVMSFSKIWNDDTLSFKSNEDQSICYVCDNMYRSVLNDASKELIF